MAEQEVIKHTKKIIDISTEKDTGFWNKLKDFLLEIFIIVFAVSLSISFHNWSEHRNEQNQVKTFLLGLRQDIREDLADVKGDLAEYDEYRRLYTWLGRLDKNHPPDTDSLKNAINEISTTTGFTEHNSRFNGFLSAGKIMNIESDSLTQNILNYYQVIIPDLRTSEDGWISQHGLLSRFILDNIETFENEKTTLDVLTTTKAKYLTRQLIPWLQLIERYQAIIDRGNAIIAAIDNTYP
jgi:hypothetical protein